MSLFAGKNENLIWVIVIFVILICTCNDNNGCHEECMCENVGNSDCGCLDDCVCSHKHECCECHRENKCLR
ncbi:MAG: hypothetical protein E7411_08370 [Ruminococcaceae bacterium]|nr:hypothetical protein [Oscillospiraceae bacterium]